MRRNWRKKNRIPSAEQNYLEIAQANRNLTEAPPRTFREACQFLAHFQSVDRMYYVGGALGRMDMLLQPYYEKDTENGAITEEKPFG